MEIKLKEVTVRELADGYKDNGENGVFGYHGRLNIRPPFQREFVYKENQRNAVIDTIRKNFPLNTMYWAVNEDSTYEIIDGQQRTVSICQYINGDFSFNELYFHNLTDVDQKQILNYKLTIYFCKGNDKEKLNWFETINIAGEKLTKQELLNAVYSGRWVSDAKRYFSKTGCGAYRIGKDYLKGKAIRQEYLETAIKWAAMNDKDCITSQKPIALYMAKHQNDDNASALWALFQKIINWVRATFPKYDRFQKGVDWGELYWQFKDDTFDTDKLQREISKLMMDDDVTNKNGIFNYVLTRDESKLSIREFTESQKRTAYEQQKGICLKCGKHFEYEEMEGDHINPWSEGGHTTPDNLQMLCKHCNRMKSNK